jgi:lysophospholipase
MTAWALLLALLVSGAQGLENDWWVAADGSVLREAVWFPEGERRGTLVVLPGHQEFAEKYEELAEWATSQNWEVRFLEWRGQGLSDRVLEDRQKAHQLDFAIPARDLADWLDAREERLVRPVIVVAHSMGANLALRALADRPRMPVDALVLASPMLVPSTRPFPASVARLTAALAVRLGLNEQYAPGQGPYIRERQHFDKNQVTSDPYRWAVHHDHFQERPELALGGVTWGWLAAAMRSWRVIDSTAPETVHAPVLILSAPEDRMVVPRLHSDFCSRLRDCELAVFPGARHELFMEADEHRQRVLQRVESFLDRLARDPGP